MSTIEQALAKIQREHLADAAAALRATEEPAPAFATGDAPPEPRGARRRAPSFAEGAAVKLPFERMRELSLLTPDASRSHLAEEYRAIKRPLLRNIDGKGAETVANANLIMVTSAMPGEGKTYTAINLAMSIAMEKDRTVLLVDGDVAKPSVASRLGIETGQGLIDVLASDRQLDVAEVMLRTNLPNVRFLPAGRSHDRATELLASEDMAALMAEFSTRYRDRVVIFDSPPLLLTSESSVLASMMGQVVLIVAAQQTPQYLVKDAIARLGEEQIVGLVLNKFRPSLGNRYGAGYGYGYYGKGRYGYRDETPEPQPDDARQL